MYDGNREALTALDDRVQIRKAGSTIQRIKVWSEDGLILYSDDPRLIGQRYPLDPDDLRVLKNGGVDSDISDLSKSENVLDRQFGESLEVYVGTQDEAGHPILVETYFTVDRLHADEAALIRRIVPVVLAALLVLGLLLVPLAYSLASRVARYERERQAMIRLAVEASSAERRRVAGELHDGVIQDLAGVGYALTALDTQIAGLADSGSSGSAPPIGALRATLRTAQRLVHDDVLALRELTGMQYAADSGAADPAAALQVIVDGLRDEGADGRDGRRGTADAAGRAPGRADPGRPGGAAQRGQTRPRRERHADPRHRGRTPRSSPSPTTAPASTRPRRSARSTATSAWPCWPTPPKASAAGWTCAPAPAAAPPSPSASRLPPQPAPTGGGGATAADHATTTTAPPHRPLRPRTPPRPPAPADPPDASTGVEPCPA